jgi:hypothetical protein
MRTAGLMMSDVWAHRVLREYGVETIRAEGQEAEIGVLVDSVSLAHHGPETRFRPYLHLTGQLTWVSLAQALPFGINEVTYDQAHSEKVGAYYEFDDAQLVTLTGKGYFNTDFDVPEQVTGIEWELPARVDAMVLVPKGPEEQPVVFVNIHDVSNLEINLENSGYDIAEYFHDHSGGTQPEGVAVGYERGPRTRSDAINSLFTDGQPALGAGEAAQAQIASPMLEATAAATGMEGAEIPLAAQLAEAEAQLAGEYEEYLAHLRSQDGTPENLYAQKVASTLTEEITTPSTPPEEMPEEMPEERPEDRKHEISRHARDIGLHADNEADAEAATDADTSAGLGY